MDCVQSSCFDSWLAGRTLTHVADHRLENLALTVVTIMTIYTTKVLLLMTVLLLKLS